MPALTPYQQKALQSDQHISLTANAGSGKTFVLARRYVDIAVKKVKSLQSIVAITFTEQAASELNKKIAGEINSQLETEENPKLAYKLKQIRDQLVSANISTIHSFCTNILREFSPEAGIDANFIPIEQDTANEILELELEELFKEFFADEKKAEKIKGLIRVFGSRGLLSKELTRSVNKRARFVKLQDELYNKTSEELTSELETLFRKVFKDLFNDKPAQLIQKIRELNDHVLSVDPANRYGVDILYLLNSNTSLQSEETLICLNNLRQHVLTTSGTLRSSGYLKKVKETDLSFLAKEIEQGYELFRFFDFGENYKDTYKTLAEFSYNFSEVLAKLIERYNKHKTTNGLVDFEDLLFLAKKVLSLDEVKEYLADTYHYIMVDEYQDTNEIQYDIFMPILDELRKNNLFVVGDEKQSIYRFRDAELKVFNKTRKDIKDRQGDEGILNLPHSFRVSPVIAQFVNYLFSRVFAGPDLRFSEVEHKDLLCARNPEDGGSVEFLISDKEESDQTEAEMITNEIINLFAGKAKGEVSFSDFAILCRKRKNFKELEKAFEEARIPYTILGGKGFYQKQVVLDVFNYLSFLLNNDDDAALAGVLRSPFYLLSDKELFSIYKSEGYNLCNKLTSYSSEISRYKRVSDLIGSHIKLAKRSDASGLLEQILEDTNYLAVIASRVNSDQEVANLKKLVNLTRKYNSEGFTTLYDFVEFLRESIKAQEDEGQAELSASGDSVKILTIHQSKGLEYKIVFLYGSNDKVFDDRIKSKTVVLDESFGILTPLPENQEYFGEYYSSPLIGLHNYINDRKNVAEYKRLLYVAATRAIDHLYICATINSDKTNKNSFIRIIQDALGLDFTEEKIEINDPLNFMAGEEREFEVFSKVLPVTVPVKKAVEAKYKLEEQEDETPSEFILSDKIVDDLQQNEFVSATKIATFLQCPVKYQLTYELGYAGLKNLLELDESKLADEKENDEERSDALVGRNDLIGRVVHRILEENPGSMFIESRMKELMNEDETFRKLDEPDKVKYSEEISSLVLSFIETEVYKKLSAYPNYMNEYEIYHRVNDYYLYGIVDKLILTKDKIYIVDWKTDHITDSKVEEKKNLYLPQLMFYAYILNRMYPGKKVYISLVFVRHPDKSLSVKIEDKEIKEFGQKIEEIVTLVRYKKFTNNLAHCIKCHYTVKGKCPLKPEEN